MKNISQEKSFWDQFKYPLNIRDGLVFLGGVLTGKYGIDFVRKKWNEYSEKRDRETAKRVAEYIRQPLRDEMKEMLKELYKESGVQK